MMAFLISSALHIMIAHCLFNLLVNQARSPFWVTFLFSCSAHIAMGGESATSSPATASRAWSCDTLFRGASFLAEQQRNKTMTSAELLEVSGMHSRDLQVSSDAI